MTATGERRDPAYGVPTDNRQSAPITAVQTESRMPAEEELFASRQMLQLVLDCIPQRVFWKDRSSRYLGCSRLCARDAGLADPAEIVGKDDFDLPWKALADAYRVDDRQVMSDNKPKINFEESILYPDGSRRWIRTSKVPLHDRQGRVIGIMGTYEDITDQKRSEEQLRQSLAELERSNRDLERFAYVASHDLQEPLRMVSSYLQLLARRYLDKLDKDADAFIGYAVDGATRMQRLIEDLLAYARAGTRGNPFLPVNCNLIVARNLKSLGPLIDETGAVVTYDDLPTVMADEYQLAQVFQNLIINGIKFRTNQPPKVHVRADFDDDAKEWRFAVRDNGIGIALEYHRRIFDMFQRLHNREKYPGTGIGLAISERIVSRHGGRIWVESIPGDGSIFYFTIPDRRHAQ